MTAECQGLRSGLAKVVRHAEARYCLRDFRKVWSMRQDRPFIWENHWKQLGWHWKLSGVGISGNYQGKWTILHWLMETQIWPPFSSLGEGGSLREYSRTVVANCLEKAISPALVLMQTIQFLSAPIPPSWPEVLTLLNFKRTNVCCFRTSNLW